MTSQSSPRTLEEALRRLSEDPACIPIAGCTDWMIGARSSGFEIPPLLDLLRVEELRGIRSDGDGLRIGATTTFSDLQQDELVRKSYPVLVQAAGEVGGRQIQNRATLGGNVVNASPAGDSLPVLLALDAEVEVASLEGRRRIPFRDFHTAYRRTALGEGELLTAVILPPAPGFQSFRKVGTRQAQAISKVVVAICAENQEGRWASVRIGAGSVAATPIRLRAAEAVLEGSAVGKATAEAAADAARGEAHPIDDLRSTARYRSWVLGRVVRRMLLS